VVQVIDNRGEQETGTIVVKLDKLTATLRWKMKIPCTEKANLRPPQLCNCWRLFQSCRPPWLTRRNCVKDADEFGDFRPWHYRKFCRHARHSGSLKRGEESLWKCCFELQPNPSS
jgi:hypothetical protein